MFKYPKFVPLKLWQHYSDAKNKSIDIQNKWNNGSICLEKKYKFCEKPSAIKTLEVYSYICAFCIRFVPIVALSVLTILMVVKFTRVVRKRKCKHIGGDVILNNEGTFSGEELRMIVIMIVTAVIFLICNTPAMILTILFIDDSNKFRTSVSYAIFRAISNNIELLGSCLNLIIYCICSKDIRKAYTDNFSKLLGCFTK